MSYGRYYRNRKLKVGEPYCIFNFHDKESPKIKNKNIIICSIDPGIVNTAIYVLCYNLKTKEQKSMHLSKHSFNDDNWVISMTKQLSNIEDEKNLFSLCHFIVIESQMSFNYDATKLAQAILTLLGTMTRNKNNRPLIIELSSQCKTKILGCLPRTTGEDKNAYKRRYKKWSVEKALEILTENEDTEYLEFIRSERKKDDLGDAICQCNAWIKIITGEVYTPDLDFMKKLSI